MRLRRTESTVGSSDRAIRIGDFADKPSIGTVIKVSKPVSQSRRYSITGSVRSCVEGTSGINGCNRTVPFEPHIDFSRRGVAPFAVTEFFLARVTHAHGSACFARQESGDQTEASLVFTAEAAAQIGRDDAHSFVRQFENACQLVAVTVDVAAGFPQRQSLALPRCDAVAGLK